MWCYGSIWHTQVCVCACVTCVSKFKLAILNRWGTKQWWRTKQWPVSEGKNNQMGKQKEANVVVAMLDNKQEHNGLQRASLYFGWCVRVNGIASKSSWKHKRLSHPVSTHTHTQNTIDAHDHHFIYSNNNKNSTFFVWKNEWIRDDEIKDYRRILVDVGYSFLLNYRCTTDIIRAFLRSLAWVGHLNVCFFSKVACQVIIGIPKKCSY